MTENANLAQVKQAASFILSNEAIERHSLFQLQCFVLAKEPTIQGKLHQCLLEIKTRNQSLGALDLEIEDQKDKLELIDLDIADVNALVHETPTQEKRKEIKIRSLERQRKAIENNVKELEKKQKDISEEMQFFCSAFDQLNRREKLKPWDDPDVQKEYWSEKLRFEVNTRLLLRQLPDVELLKTVLCLNDDSPIKKGVVDMLKKANEQAALTQKQA
jgi:chromosome segregation ATPase